MKISCCICIYEDLLSLNTDEVIDLIANCSLLPAGFMIIESENEIYICCRETIVFVVNIIILMKMIALM